MSMFKKAVKESAKLRLAIAGPSGSGKTFTSLAIATALGGPIAVIDTEHGSASKYADLFEFDVAEMHAPFHPQKYIDAIREAANAGYKVIILDSLTHAWNGTGGILDIVENATKRMQSKNSYTAWKEATPIQNQLTDAIVGAGIHVIATMRSKQEYVQEKDSNNKTVIRKVGMAPVQREGLEYEFDVFLDMDVDNNAIVTKTRCPALTGEVFAKPGKNIAAILAAWLSSGVQPQAKQADQAQGEEPKAQQNEIDLVSDIISKNNLTDPKVTQAWAVTNKYCTNAHHARNRMAKIVDDSFAGKVNPTNVKQVIAAFVAKCLAEGVQPEPTEAPTEPVQA